MSIPDSVLDLDLVDLSKIEADYGRIDGIGFKIPFVSDGYGVVVDNLARIKDPKFQKGLLAVDKTLRPKKYKKKSKKKRDSSFRKRLTTADPDTGEDITQPYFLDDSEREYFEVDSFDSFEDLTDFEDAFEESLEGSGPVRLKGTVLGIVALRIQFKTNVYNAMNQPVVRALRVKKGKWIVPIKDVADLAMFKIKNRKSKKRRLSGNDGIGAITPTFDKLSLSEAEALLEGLVNVNMVQYRDGVQSVIEGIESGAIVYNRRDKSERWKPIKKLWEDGEGDCEDLAAALAAERRLQGDKGAKVYVKPGKGNVAHAVTLLGNGQIEDPSVWAGMGL